MTIILSIILVIIGQDIDPTKIARINDMKAEAKNAFESGNFKESAELYTYLLDSMKIEDENVTLNLAHSYFKLNETENAKSQYEKLQNSKNREIKSLAYQQLGVLSKDPQNLDKALAYFKESIRSNPSNEDARYNYELVKKWLDKQEKEEKNQDNKDDKKEPSEYAKRLKEQADRLVLQNRYREANNLMNEGLKIDQTVSYYNDFIVRTKEVADINN